MESMKNSLFKAMCIRNEYTERECAEQIRTMCWHIDRGDDPEELLHQEGLEADYVEELLEHYSDYMDEQEERKEYED
jgi:hypothetical protein